MRKIVYLIIILFLLSSCFSGRSKPSNFYNLVPIENNNIKIKTKKDLTIGIEPILVAKYLDRSEIITIKENETELNISDFNRWAEPLSNSIQRVIINNLSNYMINSTIMPTNTYKKAYDYTIFVYITKFEGKFNDKVYLESWYFIYDKNGKNIINEKVKFNMELGNNYENLVWQESVLISKLSKKIAEKLSKI